MIMLSYNKMKFLDYSQLEKLLKIPKRLTYCLARNLVQTVALVEKCQVAVVLSLSHP